VSYRPDPEILERYASVFVNFALGGGEGVKPGQVVLVTAPESAKPLYVAVLRAVTRAGGNVISRYSSDDDAAYNVDRDFFELASDEQIAFFPRRYWRGLIDEVDHMIALLCEADPHALEGVPPGKIMRRGAALRPLIEWRTEKENAGRFTWTLGLYGTPAMAAEAGLSEQEYWDQIIHACFLDEDDPIARWREVSEQIDDYKQRLGALDIDRLHILGEDVDLEITLGEARQWVGGSGHNIPSFEIFTSPDWRGTNGWIYFNQPLYRYGNLVKGVRIEFKDGRVTGATAEQNEELITEMVATENADKVGEFSLTDRRFSRITKFMAQTLYDENVGGQFGNTHIALGKSYHDCYAGDPSTVSAADWERLGFNDSTVHTDIVSTSDRTVTARLRDGSELVIYAGGEFKI
jgi:aminopeptidase